MTACCRFWRGASSTGAASTMGRTSATCRCRRRWPAPRWRSTPRTALCTSPATACGRSRRTAHSCWRSTARPSWPSSWKGTCWWWRTPASSTQCTRLCNGWIGRPERSWTSCPPCPPWRVSLKWPRGSILSAPRLQASYGYWVPRRILWKCKTTSRRDTRGSWRMTRPWVGSLFPSARAASPSSRPGPCRPPAAPRSQCRPLRTRPPPRSTTPLSRGSSARSGISAQTSTTSLVATPTERMCRGMTRAPTRSCSRGASFPLLSRPPGVLESTTECCTLLERAPSPSTSATSSAANT
mmetsp:Transcript_5666/g.10387  ORF Transcript_5666/g.10387 Transcript_5666/m.10387 type:complete len:296 (+) Transcript_5666:2450-3337(+)